MFLAHRHRPAALRLTPPRAAKDTMHRLPASRPNAAWHHLAMGVRVSQPHDPAEHEADRVADAVIQGQAVAVHPAAADGASVRRMCAACEEEQRGQEEETPIQAKRESEAVGPTAGDAV